MFKKKIETELEIIDSVKAAEILGITTWQISDYVRNGKLQAKYTNVKKSSYFSTGSRERLYFDKMDVLDFKKRLKLEKKFKLKGNNTFSSKVTVIVDEDTAEMFLETFKEHASTRLWQWAQGVIENAILNGESDEWIYGRT